MSSRQCIRGIVFLLLFAALPPALFALDTIRLEPTLINPDTPENRRDVEVFLDRVRAFAGRTYGGYFTFGGKGDYTLRLIINLEENSVGNLLMKKGERETSLPFFGGVSPENVPYFTALTAALWNGFTGVLSGMEARVPELMDVVPTEVLLSSVPGLMPSLTQALAPVSGAVLNDGGLLVAFGSLALELDTHLGIAGTVGKDLLEAGNYTGAGGVFVTPAGTVFLKPSSGRTALKYPAGATVPVKVPLGMDPYGPFTVLHDGRIVAGDIMSRKIYLIDGRSRLPLILSAGTNSYISYLGTDPGGYLWSWDTVERRFKIHTTGDTMIGSVVPVSGPALSVSPGSFAIYPDGGFVMTGNGPEGTVMTRYGRDGVPLWSVDGLDLPFPEKLPMNAVPVFDPGRGYLYLLDMTGRRIIRFLDREWAQEYRLDTEEADRLIGIHAEIVDDPENSNLYGRAADLYLEYGALEPAVAVLSRLLDADPYDREIRDRKEALEVDILKRRAGAERERTLELLERFGPSTARTSYSDTLQIYEKILSFYPGDEEAREEMEDLKRLYTEKSEGPVGVRPTVEVVRTDLDNLFPSLMLFYRHNPAGRLTLRNTGNTAVTDIEVSFFINRYMDFPSVTRFEGDLGPGDSGEVNLFGTLNERVLSLQEDLPVQGKIEISWRGGTGGSSLTEVTNLTIYRNTSLSWDYSGKLASFITPNDGVISNFSLRVSGSLSGTIKGFPEKIVQGAMLCDALGVYGIEYIEDPDSPFSDVLGKEEVLDTVRFPRTTLYVRAGDCDDTTALLASLLEASGIETAVMTSPGHVFLAFNTDEPVENLRLFVPSGYEGIRWRGRVWVPVETTTLDRGFLHSWKAASETIRNHPNAVEFLPVSEERNTYPPLPLPGGAMSVVEPQGEEIAGLFDASIADLVSLVYTEETAELENALRTASGREELRIRNRIGVLHARFGNIDTAREYFTRNMETDPAYPASYLNLANLYIGEGRVDRAREILLTGIEWKPDSAPLNLLLSRIYSAEGNEKSCGQYFARVEASEPDLAARFAPPPEGEGAARAGIEDLDSMLIWDIEE